MIYRMILLAILIAVSHVTTRAQQTTKAEDDKAQTIFLGGATVKDCLKSDIRYDRGKPVYCVWLREGIYAEYPEQSNQNIKSYYARDKQSSISEPITESIYKKGENMKDGKEYIFEVDTNLFPTITCTPIAGDNDEKCTIGIIDGFDGITWKGGPDSADNIYVSNSKKVHIITNNDDRTDYISLMINCKSCKLDYTQGVDVISRWKGYKKGNGYNPKFADK